MTMPAKIDRYEIRAELGRGGMATVYRAFDPRFDREVAIKVLPRHFLHDPAFAERFVTEAKLVASLEHHAIVPVYDFGGVEDQPFLAMRLLTGGSLRARLKHNGALPLEEINRIISHLAPGLDAAHSRGIIHRDLKPDNILFDDFDAPYLADFGIARLSEATRTMTIIGTPAYMSPEQWVGEVTLDGRSDIYALGVVLFEMLTGGRPYKANTPAGLMHGHVYVPVPNPLDSNPNLPAGVRPVIETAMAKDRDARFSNAVSLAAGLSGALHKADSMDQAEHSAVPTATNADLPDFAGQAFSDDETGVQNSEDIETNREAQLLAGAKPPDKLEIALAPASHSADRERQEPSPAADGPRIPRFVLPAVLGAGGFLGVVLIALLLTGAPGGGDKVAAVADTTTPEKAVPTATILPTAIATETRASAIEAAPVPSATQIQVRTQTATPTQTAAAKTTPPPSQISTAISTPTLVPTATVTSLPIASVTQTLRSTTVLSTGTPDSDFPDWHVLDVTLLDSSPFSLQLRVNFAGEPNWEMNVYTEDYCHLDSCTDLPFLPFSSNNYPIQTGPIPERDLIATLNIDGGLFCSAGPIQTQSVSVLVTYYDPAKPANTGTAKYVFPLNHTWCST